MVRKGIRIGPRRVRAPGMVYKLKILPQIIFNNRRSSIKPGSAPDPDIVYLIFKEDALHCP